MRREAPRCAARWLAVEIDSLRGSCRGSVASPGRVGLSIQWSGEAGGLTPEEIDAAVYAHHHFSPHAVTRLLTDNRDWAFRCEDHRRVAVPTLVLVGDIDAGGYMLPEELDYYRTIASPQLSFWLWPNVGHSMRGTLPEQYNEELAAFLAE